MSRYKAYPEYKNSGLQWLGEMPSHWVLRKSKYVFNRVQREVRPDDGVVTAFRDGQVTLRSNRRTEGFTESIKEIGYQGVRKGDLLVHAMDGFAGAIGVSDSDGKCSPVCSVCVPTDQEQVHVAYFGYLVRQLAVTDFISSLAKGIRERSTEFRYSEFSVLDLALPPQNEQADIAAFLDHETAKIDALIEKQQRLIELLKEKRQAVISHAVTKGLNPNAPMKDSGVEWADRVPAHWRVSKLGYHANVSNGATPNRENMLFWENGTIGWLNSSKVNDEVIKEADQFITDLALSQTSVKSVNKGDLVMAITGEGQTRGRVAICNIEATINQHLAAISIRDKLLQHEFLYFWLEGNYERIRYESEGAGSTKGAITCSEISAFPVILPPLEEQDQIVNYVAERKCKFGGLIGKAISAIELMQERRTALISAAVTGKIDVRDWQAAA
ncbi:Type-1 restriction enzyme EcoKI specificity protein [compost metagenome]